MSESMFKWVSLGLLCTSIVAGGLAFYYLNQYNVLKADYEATIKELEDLTVLVDILIDYGDEVEWYNDTRIPLGTDLVTATSIICDIEYSMSEWGAFVNSINGVEGDSSTFWLWNYYDNGWFMGEVGADQRILHDGEILSWVYSKSF
jgi:hypothetical protein